MWFDWPQVNRYLISSAKDAVYQDVSLAAKLLQTCEIRNYLKNLKIGQRQSLAHSLSSRNKIFITAVKSCAKAEITFFCSNPSLLDFSNVFRMLCPRMWIR